MCTRWRLNFGKAKMRILAVNRTICTYVYEMKLLGIACPVVIVKGIKPTEGYGLTTEVAHATAWWMVWMFLMTALTVFIGVVTWKAAIARGRPVERTPPTYQNPDIEVALPVEKGKNGKQ